MGYLTNKMLMYFDPITTDISESVLNVSIGKKKMFSLGEMFSCGLKFVIDILRR